MTLAERLFRVLVAGNVGLMAFTPPASASLASARRGGEAQFRDQAVVQGLVHFPQRDRRRVLERAAVLHYEGTARGTPYKVDAIPPFVRAMNVSPRTLPVGKIVLDDAPADALGSPASQRPPIGEFKQWKNAPPPASLLDHKTSRLQIVRRLEDFLPTIEKKHGAKAREMLERADVPEGIKIQIAERLVRAYDRFDEHDVAALLQLFIDERVADRLIDLIDRFLDVPGVAALIRRAARDPRNFKGAAGELQGASFVERDGRFKVKRLGKQIKNAIDLDLVIRDILGGKVGAVEVKDDAFEATDARSFTTANIDGRKKQLDKKFKQAGDVLRMADELTASQHEAIRGAQAEFLWLIPDDGFTPAQKERIERELQAHIEALQHDMRRAGQQPLQVRIRFFTPQTLRDANAADDGMRPERRIDAAHLDPDRRIANARARADALQALADEIGAQWKEQRKALFKRWLKELVLGLGKGGALRVDALVQLAIDAAHGNLNAAGRLLDRWVPEHLDGITAVLLEVPLHQPLKPTDTLVQKALRRLLEEAGLHHEFDRLAIAATSPDEEGDQGAHAAIGVRPKSAAYASEETIQSHRQALQAAIARGELPAGYQRLTVTLGGHAVELVVHEGLVARAASEGRSITAWITDAAGLRGEANAQQVFDALAARTTPLVMDLLEAGPAVAGNCLADGYVYLLRGAPAAFDIIALAHELQHEAGLRGRGDADERALAAEDAGFLARLSNAAEVLDHLRQLAEPEGFLFDALAAFSRGDRPLANGRSILGRLSELVRFDQVLARLSALFTRLRPAPYIRRAFYSAS